MMWRVSGGQAPRDGARPGASWWHPEVRTFGTAGKSGGDDDGGDDYHVLCMTVTVQDSHDCLI